jgi:hypothetical protein
MGLTPFPNWEWVWLLRKSTRDRVKERRWWAGESHMTSRAVGERAARHAARALAHRECPALAARRHLPRGRRPQSQGSRPRQHRHSALPCPRCRACRQEQGLTVREAQTRRLGRRVPAQDARSNAILITPTNPLAATRISQLRPSWRWRMSKNPVQFQKGMSLEAFLSEYGTEVQCRAAST